MAIPVQDSTRRMALISEQLYENLKAESQKQRLTETPTFTKARTLDTEIKTILENPAMSSLEKFQRYGNALKEFTLFSNIAPETNQSAGPLLDNFAQMLPVVGAAPLQQAPIPVTPPQALPGPSRARIPSTQEFKTPPGSPEAPALPQTPVPALHPDSDQLTPSDILQAFTGEKQKSVQNLLRIMGKHSDHFGYDGVTGELALLGKTVQGAELIPILGFVTAKKKGLIVPKGVNRFLHQLQVVDDDLKVALPNWNIRNAATKPKQAALAGQGKMKQSDIRLKRWQPY